MIKKFVGLNTDVAIYGLSKETEKNLSELKKFFNVKNIITFLEII